MKSPPEEGISDAKSILEEGTSGAKPVPEEPGRREVTALVHRSCELLPTPWARRTTPPSSVHVETPSPSQITEHHYESTAFTPTSSPYGSLYVPLVGSTLRAPRRVLHRLLRVLHELLRLPRVLHELLRLPRVLHELH